MQVISLSRAQANRKLGRSRGESIAKIWVKNSAIGIIIVSSREEIQILFVGEEIKLTQGIKELWSSDPAFGSFIKHLESIHQVKVCLLCKLDLCFFQFSFESNLLLESSHKLLFIINLHWRRSFWILGKLALLSLLFRWGWILLLWIWTLMGRSLKQFSCDFLSGFHRWDCFVRSGLSGRRTFISWSPDWWCLQEWKPPATCLWPLRWYGWSLTLWVASEWAWPFRGWLS